MEEIAAQLEQLNDRARHRAVGLAEAVRSAGSGKVDAMEQLQHQQDDQVAVRGRCGR
jgi:low affinity Fe/Cu permease